MSVVSSLFVPAVPADSGALSSSAAVSAPSVPRGASSVAADAAAAGTEAHGFWDALFDADDADAALDDDTAQDVCFRSHRKHTHKSVRLHMPSKYDLNSTCGTRATA